MLKNTLDIVDINEERYARQLCLPAFGLQQQLLLKQAKVVIIGAGGLGCPVALYLAGAGVGEIIIADGDAVDLSNLHRQIAHDTNELGQNKASNLVKKLTLLNPDNTYIAVAEHVHTSNKISEICENANLLLDCTDNFETHFLLADTCQHRKLPWVSGSVYQYQGQVMSFLPDISTCYRCLYQQTELQNMPACSELGALGPITGVIGSLMAGEALQLLLGESPPSVKMLLHYDYHQQQLRHFKRSKAPDCTCN